MNTESITIDWSECIVIFNSLIRSIETLRDAIDNEIEDDDELYDAEEELNDYVILLARLKEQYFELKDKGDLPKKLLSKLNNI